jgi:2-succinyl-5-enolpyruvyl-6-hydroxy-3-cyclohexene-1-carboxylate synthase
LNAPNLNALFARALVDELCAAGATEAIVSPGSRSAPLALACANEPRLRVRVVVDERSAAFVALGAAKATGRPAIAVATSGTAGAHFYPAALEAEASRIPVVLLTADRPPELHGFGAPQTIDQQHLFGRHVRFFADLGVPAPLESALRHVRATAALACARALSTPGGPVHLNCPFREPLAPVPEPYAPLRDAPALRISPGTLVADPAALDAAADELSRRRRGVIVCGPRDAWDDLPEAVRALSEATGYPVLAETASQVRYRLAGAVAHYDSILKHKPTAQALRPDAVVRIGGGLTSKTLQQWLDSTGAWTLLLSDDGTLVDPSHSASLAISGSAPLSCTELSRRISGTPYVTRTKAGVPYCVPDFGEAERRARAALEAAFARDDALTEPAVAREVAAALPEGAQLFVSSSMPVRDVDAWAARAAPIRVLANRGVNGIDGVVSSALGAALATRRPTVALVGDLALLHDLGGLVAAARLGAPLSIVAVDNDGGGIFSFLPIASTTEHFEALFGTPHGLDVGRAAALAGARLHTPAKLSELRAAVRESLAGGLHLVHVRTDRARNVAEHAALHAAVCAVLEGGR